MFAMFTGNRTVSTLQFYWCW